jgi:hypothetical protein
MRRAVGARSRWRAAEERAVAGSAAPRATDRPRMAADRTMSRADQNAAAKAPVRDFTIASQQRDFSEWHLGRPLFAVWALALEDPALDVRLRQVRTALDGLLLRGYERQPHITLHVCGFPTTTARRNDDFAVDEIKVQIDALVQSDIAAFDVHVSEPFTFTSAACLSVEDAAGSLTGIRSIWERAAPTWDRSISSVDWMCYESARIAGPLRTLIRFDLERRQAHVVDGKRLRQTFGQGAGQLEQA